MLLAAPAAFLSAVFLFASVDAGRFCSSSKFGDLKGRPLQLPPIPLPDRNNHLYIGDSCYTLGPYFKIVGFKITACDRWKPLVIANKIDHAWVRLMGISRNAVAHVTQYCKPIFHAYGGDSEEDEAVPYEAEDSAPSDQYDD